MEERDRVLIEKYIADELSIAERQDIEQRLKDDPMFKNEFEEYMLTMDALKIAQREELRERFRKRDRILDRRDSGYLHRPKSLWLLAAIVTGVVLLTWLAYYGFKQPAQEEIFTGQDSIINQQQLPVIDSGKLAETKETAPDMAVNNVKWEEKEKNEDKGTELFAENFDPYVDESMDVAMRGDDDDLLPVERFQIHYAEKDFAGAVKDYSQMPEDQQQNDNVRFIYGNALMALNRIDESISIMQKVMLNKKSIYHTEAGFYLALGNIKKGKYNEAKQILQVYVQDSESEQKDKAVKILQELK